MIFSFICFVRILKSLFLADVFYLLCTLSEFFLEQLLRLMNYSQIIYNEMKWKLYQLLNFQDDSSYACYEVMW